MSGWPCNLCGADPPECEGEGWVRTEAGAKRCPRYLACSGPRILAASGIPPRFRETTFDDVRTDLRGQAQIERALRVARRWVEVVAGGGKVPPLYLQGPPGTGKTMLACAALRLLGLAGFSVRFQEVTELLLLLGKRIEDPSRPDPLAELLAADVVVVDEIGARRPTPHAVDTLFLLVNGRDGAMAPTIYTGNLTLPALEPILGPRTTSRLYEAEPILLDQCEDYRKRRDKGRATP